MDNTKKETPSRSSSQTQNHGQVMEQSEFENYFTNFSITT